MRVNVILTVAVLALGLVDAARRRDRLRTTTTPLAPLVDRQFAFVGQPEELENPWNNFDSHKLNVRAGAWKNDTENNILSVRQYPGLPNNPGDTNELPNPISPPVQPAPPPYKPPPGCLGSRGQYSSPNSCANYLNCWDDVMIEQTCPAGLLFNDVAGYCDFAYNVKCGDRLPATPKPPLPAGSKLCPDLNGRYRSSTNCSEFYVCAAGKPIKFYCPLGLVYSDILNVCDYQYNVDCKGTATPKPLRPTQPPTQSPQPSSTYTPKPSIPPSTPSTYPPQPSTYPPQPPTYPPQPPTYQPQPPTYQPQPPTYSPQLPTHAPQPPSYPPKPPGYQPQPYPSPPPSYGNPWLNRGKSESWHQRNLATQLEIDKEIQKQEISTDISLNNQPTHDAIETSSLTNSWTLLQETPSELMRTPCYNGEIYKLNNFCTEVIVCRNNKPVKIDCPSGLSYDKPSDKCMPFHVAICELATPAPKDTQ